MDVEGRLHPRPPERADWVWVGRWRLFGGLNAAADLTCIRWWCEVEQCWESGITSEPGVRYEVLVPPDWEKRP